MPQTQRPPRLICTDAFEVNLRRAGYQRIAGIDEVGRGALCGPVVAAAVILDPARIPGGIDDSKKLSASRRETLSKEILRTALAVGVGRVEPEGIDSKNILQATLQAMSEAVGQLEPPADFLLLDAVRLPSVDLPQKSVIKGDAQCVSIAAASIIAKVWRDRIMVEFDQLYPQYALDQNKGYGTPEHIESLRRFGPSPIHRRTFRPVYQLDFPFGPAPTEG